MAKISFLGQSQDIVKLLEPDIDKDNIPASLGGYLKATNASVYFEIGESEALHCSNPPTDSCADSAPTEDEDSSDFERWAPRRTYLSREDLRGDFSVASEEEFQKMFRSPPLSGNSIPVAIPSIETGSEKCMLAARAGDLVHFFVFHVFSAHPISSFVIAIVIACIFMYSVLFWTFICVCSALLVQRTL